MHVEGDVHLLAGDVDAADADYRRTLAAVRERESREPWVRAQLGLAAVAAARGQGAEAEALLLTCAKVCAQRRLLKLLPTVWLEQIHRSMTQGRAEDARAPLRALSRTLREWKSPPGQARCDLIAAALSGQKSGEQTELAPEAREPLARVLALPQTVLRDVVPYLRRESSWAVPLLLAALRTGIKSDQARELVASIGDEAVPYLLPLLSGGPLADTAVTLLGAIGDPRARRPLARLAARRGTPLGRAAQRALRGLREPEPVVLDIHLLGTLVVRRNGVPIGAAEWRTQKVKALLKYLILHRSRPIPQDELIDVLWPDVDPQTGAGRLKTTLKTLRQVLEPLLEGSRSTFVIRAGSTLRWADAGRARLDLDEYDRLVALAEGHQAAGRTSDAVVALDEAARLYRGDLLEDDRYDEWVISEREARREQHLRVLESLADLHATRQDFRRAMEVVQQIVVLDRLREPAYQRLIRYALARGERATALRAYETCARLLREELGVDPQPDTLALLEQARAVSPR
jgi:DNA-binding SARP family transcriptional activator